MHNRHHRYCDRPLDPHSWTQTNWWYAWIGWTFYETEIEWDFVPKQFRESKMICLINWLHPVWYGAFVYFLNYHVGTHLTLWVYVLPSFVATCCVLRFNTTYHPPIEEDNCKASNRAKTKSGIAYLVGEYYHRDHHTNSKHAKRRGIDLPYYCMLYPMSKCGLIWDVCVPTVPDCNQSRQKQTM